MPFHDNAPRKDFSANRHGSESRRVRAETGGRHLETNTTENNAP